MKDPICTIAVPKTPRELELVLQRYRTSDLNGYELVCYWQAIRDASLEQGDESSKESDRVPGEASY
jgi:hypothetical protein